MADLTAEEIAELREMYRLVMALSRMSAGGDMIVHDPGPCNHEHPIGEVCMHPLIRIGPAATDALPRLLDEIERRRAATG
jgi:hypothetical protein